MLGSECSGVVSLAHAIKQRQTLREIGPRKMNPGVTVMEGEVGPRSFTMHPCQCDFPKTETPKSKSQLQLFRHYTDSNHCRLLFVVPGAGESEEGGSLPMHLLLDELLQVSPSLQHTRVLVVVVHEKDSVAQTSESLGSVQELFKRYDGRVSSSRCVTLGEEENIGKLDADLLWLCEG